MGKQRPTSHRRDFISGKSVAKVVQGQVNSNDASASTDIAPQSFLIHLTRRAMAAEFEVFLNNNRDQGELETALEVLDLLEILEEQLSVYRDQSEISEINRSAFGSPRQVEPQLFELLRQGQEFFEATSGAFDMTSTPLSRLWGFFHRQGQLPSDEDIKSTLNSIGGRHIRLNCEDREIGFDIPSVELNLGAIGKGYALDRLAQSLLGGGVSSFLLHGGASSVRAAGRRDGTEGWRIELKHPLVPTRSLGEVMLTDHSLATSGCGNQFFHHRGKRLGHIIDPRTGYPVEWEGGGVHSATVIASDAASADALATAFYVMGVEESRQYCEQNPHIAAIFVVPAVRAATEAIVVGNLEGVWRPAST